MPEIIDIDAHEYYLIHTIGELCVMEMSIESKKWIKKEFNQAEQYSYSTAYLL